jgi:hypothetical protein
MSSINQFLNGVGEGVAQLAGEYVKGAKQRGIDDMLAYVNARKADVERWGGMVERGELSPADFRDLLEGMRDEGEIRLLRVAGVELARLQRLRDALVDLVVNQALGAFLPG